CDKKLVRGRGVGRVGPEAGETGAVRGCRRGGRCAADRDRSQRSAGERPWSARTTTVGAVYEGIVQDLIDELGRLPGIGPKSAQRIAFHLLDADDTAVRRLAEVLIQVK